MSDAQAAPAEHRVAVIDLVRGVAILLVILRHLQLRIRLEHTALFEAAPTALWRLLCTNGNDGVRMFFVVSGFLITTHSLRRWGSLPAIDIRRFYQLRFARIVPTLAVLLVVLSLLHLAGIEGYTIDTERASLWRALLAAGAIHVNWLEAARNFYLPASWDLSSGSPRIVWTRSASPAKRALRMDSVCRLPSWSRPLR